MATYTPWRKMFGLKGFKLTVFIPHWLAYAYGSVFPFLFLFILTKFITAMI